MNLDQMLLSVLKNAKKIAILGLSQDPQKPSYKVAKILQEKGYTIIPISPKGGEILGERAYATLQEAFEAEEIDILNVFRKSDALPQIAQEILALKNPPQCVWVQLGLESKEARNLLENAKIPYVENLCIAVEHERLI